MYCNNASNKCEVYAMQSIQEEEEGMQVVETFWYLLYTCFATQRPEIIEDMFCLKGPHPSQILFSVCHSALRMSYIKYSPSFVYPIFPA